MWRSAGRTLLALRSWWQDTRQELIVSVNARFESKGGKQVDEHGGNGSSTSASAGGYGSTGTGSGSDNSSGSGAQASGVSAAAADYLKRNIKQGDEAPTRERSHSDLAKEYLV